MGGQPKCSAMGKINLGDSPFAHDAFPPGHQDHATSGAAFQEQDGVGTGAEVRKCKITYSIDRNI